MPQRWGRTQAKKKWQPKKTKADVFFRSFFFVVVACHLRIMATSIDRLLEEISGVEDPVEELQVLKTALLSIPVSALRDSASGQRFKVIFSLLNSNHRWVGFAWRISPTPASGEIKAAESVCNYTSDRQRLWTTGLM